MYMREERYGRGGQHWSSFQNPLALQTEYNNRNKADLLKDSVPIESNR